MSNASKDMSDFSLNLIFFLVEKEIHQFTQ